MLSLLSWRDLIAPLLITLQKLSISLSMKAQRLLNALGDYLTSFLWPQWPPVCSPNTPAHFLIMTFTHTVPLPKCSFPGYLHGPFTPSNPLLKHHLLHEAFLSLII